MAVAVFPKRKLTHLSTTIFKGIYVTGPEKTNHHADRYVDLIECFISSGMTPRTPS